MDVIETEAQLVLRCRRDRDRSAFDALVARHRQRVIGVAFARCRDVGLAEDIAQETFLVAWSGIDALRDLGEHGVGRWLAGIARNLAISAVRTRERRAHIDLVELAPLPAASPEDELVEREDRALFERALADVAPLHRDILIRYYLEGRSLAAIARADGTSEAAAKQRLSRARAAVRTAVAARADRAMARLRKPMIFTPFGKAALLMASKKLVIVGAAVALAAVGGVAWWLHARGDAVVVAATGSGNAAPSITANVTSMLSEAAAVGTDAARPTPPDVHVGKLDRPARDALLAQIRAAHARNAAAPHAPPPPPSGGVVPAGSGSDDPIDKAFIKAAVHEILPMLGDCYAEGLERNPKLAAANVVVEFTIEGEKDVGGVIGTSKIDDGKTDLADAQVRECIQETMYALKIDPPPGGGTVTVRYPFAFAPAADDGSGAPH